VGTGEPGATTFEALPADPPLRAVDAERDDVAAVLYTSATTTGRPKGVMLTHANVVSNTYATVHHLGMTREDRGLCALPLFHCFGQNFIMNALVAAGGTLVLQERFVPADFLAASSGGGSGRAGPLVAPARVLDGRHASRRCPAALDRGHGTASLSGKVPVVAEFRPALPKSPTGKILKKDLR